MFHRVKSEGHESETQDNSKKDAPYGTEAPVKVDVAPVKKSLEATATITNSTPQKKDEKPMSDQDNTKNENSPAPLIGAGYQRPGQAPARAGGYPGAYPGAMGGRSVSNASESDRRLTIGPGITMSGEIESCDYLLVEGTVEAALKGANMLEVAESGIFYGTVEIEEANIAGRFEGDITVSGRLTISSTGTVTGSISYKEIEIEAGAILDGKLTPLSGNASTAAKKPSAVKAENKASPNKDAKKSDKPEAANSDGELFSKAATAAE